MTRKSNWRQVKSLLKDKHYSFSRRAAVWTPELVLTTAQGDRVVLLGVAHLGEREYYSGVGSSIHREEARGAITFYEHVKPIKGFDTPISGILDLTIEYISRWTSDSVVRQREVLAFRPYWVHSDLDQQTAYRAMPRVSKILFSIGARCDKGMRLITGTLGLMLAYGVVITLRNKKALRVMREYFEIGEKVNAVLLWGAGHVAGMAKDLIMRDGYALESITWREAFQVHLHKEHHD